MYQRGFSRLYPRPGCLNQGLSLRTLVLRSSGRQRWRLLVPCMVAVPAVVALDHYANDATLSRSFRTVWVMGTILVVYKLYNNPTVNRWVAPRVPAEQVHEFASGLLLHLLETNKGVYIKVGQMIALQATMFPPEFITKFKRLYEHNQSDLWAAVSQTLQTELGADFERHFHHIERTPFNSGSVAQVHRAVLDSGEAVVLKVQHRALRRQIAMDLWCFTLTMKGLGLLFDLPLGLGMDFILDQIKTELDFCSEQANSERMRALIALEFGANNHRYHVPHIYPALSTGRILTFEYIDGVSLASLPSLPVGIDIKAVLSNLIHLYALQLFKWGVIHCDPHPGNFIVRKVGERDQLVILDHGLYITLPKPFQKRYCELWNALTRFDNQTLRTISEEWGIGAVDVLPALILMLSYTSSKVATTIDPLVDRTDKIKQTFHLFLVREEEFPLELTFITKTQRSLQNINQHFGSAVNRLKLLLEVAAWCEFSQSPFAGMSSPTRIRRWWDYTHALTNIYVADLFFFKALKTRQALMRVWFYVRYFFTGVESEKSQGPEDILEGMIRFVAKEYAGLKIEDGPGLFVG